MHLMAEWSKGFPSTLAESNWQLNLSLHVIFRSLKWQIGLNSIKAAGSMHLIASSDYDCEGIQFRMKAQMWLWHSTVKHKEAKPSSIRENVTGNVKLCIPSYFWSTSYRQVLKYEIREHLPSYTTAVQKIPWEKVSKYLWSSLTVESAWKY